MMKNSRIASEMITTVPKLTRVTTEIHVYVSKILAREERSISFRKKRNNN
jgi:hypothetical protein